MKGMASSSKYSAGLFLSSIKWSTTSSGELLLVSYLFSSDSSPSLSASSYIVNCSFNKAF